VVIGVLSYVLLSGGSTPSRPAAAGSSTHPSTHPSASHHPSPKPTTSSPSPASTPTRALHPANAAAYGPGGIGHGDNPQEAGLAIDGRPGSAWGTDWYNSSHFGGLQGGTGLLLNMGHRVTVSNVTVNLGHEHGASLQLRAGSSPGGLRTVARSSGAGPGGVVRLRLSSPAHARYLLIWFTALPQDAAGTYQAKVYNVIVRGTG
jgi:hypothetical protein